MIQVVMPCVGCSGCPVCVDVFRAQMVALGSWASSVGLLTAALTGVQTHRVGTSPTSVAHFVDEETESQKS